jgi:hypothetical protein
MEVMGQLISSQVAMKHLLVEEVVVTIMQDLQVMVVLAVVEMEVILVEQDVV